MVSLIVGCGKIVAIRSGSVASSVSRDDKALDQLGHFRADHMGAQQLAGLGVEHGLDQALWLAQRDRLAVADEGEAADLDLAARLPCAFASVRPTLATCGQQ